MIDIYGYNFKLRVWVDYEIFFEEGLYVYTTKTGMYKFKEANKLVIVIEKWDLEAGYMIEKSPH